MLYKSGLSAEWRIPNSLNNYLNNMNIVYLFALHSQDGTTVWISEYV